MVGAVIREGNTVLATQRGEGKAMAGFWEFPGGKIEPGESPQDALIREISEELRCTIQVGDQITTTAYDYDFGTVVLTTFWCTVVEGSPILTEHSTALWLQRDDLYTVEWAPADIPSVDLIAEHLA